MRGVVMHAPGDVRVEARPDPRIEQPMMQAIHSARPGPAAASVSSASPTMGACRVFDLDRPLDQALEGYQAMDERRAIKTLLRP